MKVLPTVKLRGHILMPDIFARCRYAILLITGRKKKPVTAAVLDKRMENLRRCGL